MGDVNVYIIIIDSKMVFVLHALLTINGALFSIIVFLILYRSQFVQMAEFGMVLIAYVHKI
jgi:hypothetical protein